MYTLIKRIRTLSLVFLLFTPLAGCGQKGPLTIPPSCSPVSADGAVRELTDADGNVLPPCPRATDAEAEGALEDEEFLDDDDNIDE